MIGIRRIYGGLMDHRWQIICCYFLIFTSLVGGEEVAFDPFAGGGQDRDESSSSPPSFTGQSDSPAFSSSVGMGNTQGFKDQGPTIHQIGIKDNDINLIFQMISDASGWSIIPSKDVKGRVSLFAKDITAAELLDRVVTLAGFVYVRQGNIISVMTYEDYVIYYGVVKRTIKLKHRDAVEIAAALKEFVTPRGKIVPDPGAQTLVLFEVPQNMKLLEDVVNKLDLRADHKVIEVIRLNYIEVTFISQQLKEIFSTKGKEESAESVENSFSLSVSSTQPAETISTMILSAEHDVVIQPITRTNHLVLRGFRKDIENIISLIKELDVPADLTTRSYQVMHLSAYDMYQILADSLEAFHLSARASQEEDSGRGRSRRRGNETPEGIKVTDRIKLGVITESNSIVVTAPEVVHRQVADFLQICDVPPLEIAGGIRTYRLENANAADVAAIIQQLIDQETERGEEDEEFKLGMGRGGPAAGGEARAGGVSGAGGGSGGGVSGESIIGVSRDRRAEKPRVTISEATNSVIIQATIQEHHQFAQLIKELDHRLPQVLLDVVIVELRDTEDLDVGVELESYQSPSDSAGHLLFTAFNLSTLDTETGVRTPEVMNGGTGALVRVDEVPIILRALQSTGNAKIRSVPRILVNDNTPGRLQSVAEEPFRQVNASDTVATTSFGGFVQAGTQIQMVPHISEGDYLRLEYEITLNSFRGTAAEGLPPARDTTTVSSKVTVPEGDTLIVGGLTYHTWRDNEDQLPLLGDIPLAGALFRRTVKEDELARLYIFISPIILRDDQFRDLRRISEKERQESGEKSVFPDNCVLDIEG